MLCKFICLARYLSLVVCKKKYKQKYIKVGLNYLRCERSHNLQGQGQSRGM